VASSPAERGRIEEGALFPRGSSPSRWQPSPSRWRSAPFRRAPPLPDGSHRHPDGGHRHQNRRGRHPDAAGLHLEGSAPFPRALSAIRMGVVPISIAVTAIQMAGRPSGRGSSPSRSAPPPNLWRQREFVSAGARREPLQPREGQLRAVVRGLPRQTLPRQPAGRKQSSPGRAFGPIS
jgi:hypothetical protein